LRCHTVGTKGAACHWARSQVFTLLEPISRFWLAILSMTDRLSSRSTADRAAGITANCHPSSGVGVCPVQYRSRGLDRGRWAPLYARPASVDSYLGAPLDRVAYAISAKTPSGFCTEIGLANQSPRMLTPLVTRACALEEPKPRCSDL